jgi:hypothetical protein
MGKRYTKNGVTEKPRDREKGTLWKLNQYPENKATKYRGTVYPNYIRYETSNFIKRCNNQKFKLKTWKPNDGLSSNHIKIGRCDSTKW